MSVVPWHRVKKIRNKVRVNIDPTAQKIAQLLRENQQVSRKAALAMPLPRVPG